jgi:hypothetical protein
VKKITNPHNLSLRRRCKSNFGAPARVSIPRSELCYNFTNHTLQSYKINLIVKNKNFPPLPPECSFKSGPRIANNSKLANRTKTTKKRFKSQNTNPRKNYYYARLTRICHKLRTMFKGKNKKRRKANGQLDKANLINLALITGINSSLFFFQEFKTLLLIRHLPPSGQNCLKLGQIGQRWSKIRAPFLDTTVPYEPG